MTDQLRHLLDTLASEVEPVDLRDRVHATARRLAMRRATAAAAGVAVLVGATAFTTTHVLTPAEGDTPLPGVAGDSACAVAEPRGQWRDPGNWATLTPQPSIDELFYLEWERATDPGVRLVSWRPGMDKPVPRCELPSEAVRNANVSPDGRWVTWVSAPDGALHIADLTGRRDDRILRRGVDGERLAPVWSPDARQLIVSDVAAGPDRAVVGVIDIADGRFTRLRHDLPGARHLVWSADGTAIAFVTGEREVVVARPDGSGQRTVPNLDRVTKGLAIVGLQSLSGPAPDASSSRWLALAIGDPGAGLAPLRPLVSNAMINTEDGREIAAVGGIGDRAKFQAFFRDEAGQGVFAHLLRRVEGTRQIELIGGNGEYWGGGEEPAALADFDLLGA